MIGDIAQDSDSLYNPCSVVKIRVLLVCRI
jgi:hypothetical protein